jgi:CRISPR/Cas system-associated exonuclease Cas4 (RecB family)
MYKLFTDKTEIFECDINITGASLTNTKARLVVETSDLNLLFKGDVDSRGKCTVPIKKLRGLIEESSKGSIRLEVIADDTYFVPWESDFEVETSKRVTVEVKSQAQRSKIVESTGPKVQVTGIKEEKITLSEKQHVINILKLLVKEEINLNNLSFKKNKLNKIIAEYIGSNPIESTGDVIDKVVKVLAKRK